MTAWHLADGDARDGAADGVQAGGALGVSLPAAIRYEVDLLCRASSRGTVGGAVFEGRRASGQRGVSGREYLPRRSST